MLSAYFDDSGTHAGSECVVFSGFVAPEEQWARFDDDWNRALSRFGLSYFHMRELRNRKGAYSVFAKDQAAEADLMRRLLSTIKVRAQHTFGVAVVRRDFETGLSRFGLSDSPFGMAAGCTLNLLRKWKERRHPSDALQVVGDEGWAEWSTVARHVESLLEVQLVPGIAKFNPRLQAADLVAWETNRQISSLLNGRMARQTAQRRSYLQLREDWSGAEWFVVDEEELTRICDAQGLARFEEELWRVETPGGVLQGHVLAGQRGFALRVLCDGKTLWNGWINVDRSAILQEGAQMRARIERALLEGGPSEKGPASLDLPAADHEEGKAARASNEVWRSIRDNGPTATHGVDPTAIVIDDDL